MNIENCWIITEGHAGTENQCLGVVSALGITPEIKRIRLRQPWKMLSPYIGFECTLTFAGDSLEPPWPDLVIASGRKSIAAVRYIKARSGGRTFAVQIQDPRISYKTFDLIAVPEHDPARGDNVVVTSAAPNRVSPDYLAGAREKFAPLLAPLPAPRVAVLIGGSSKSHTITPKTLRGLVKKLRPMITEKTHGLMVSASRRTGQANNNFLRKYVKGGNVFLWSGVEPNPYYGFLAWADFIIVTADSVSMISEAATTGKPVYIEPLDGGSKRLDQMHKNLLEKGIVRIFDGRLENYSYEPLNDASRIAEEIRKRTATRHV